MAKKNIIDLGEPNFPALAITGVELPFNQMDEGATFQMTATVKLDEFRPQGHNYTFQVRNVTFPDKDKQSERIERQNKREKIASKKNTIEIE